MPHGILHHRLKQQMWDLCIETLRRDFENDTEPVFKSRLFDLQIDIQELNFTAESSHLSVILFEAHPQQIAERGHHSVGGNHIRKHQRRNRVKRVEQEMRLQLALQAL